MSGRLWSCLTLNVRFCQFLLFTNYNNFLCILVGVGSSAFYKIYQELRNMDWFWDLCKTQNVQGLRQEQQVINGYMSTNFGQKLSGVLDEILCSFYSAHCEFSKDPKNDPDSLLECWILELYCQNIINFEAKKRNSITELILFSY